MDGFEDNFEDTTSGGEGGWGVLSRNRTSNIAAVVVTYNRKELLKTTINCLLNQKGASCDILIFDNASTDGTSIMIQENFSSEKIFYYNTGSNLGGAGGFEYGIKRAVENGYEYVWIMDDDTWPMDSALENLLLADGYLDKNWGFLSSAVYWTDGAVCKHNRPKTNIFKHMNEQDFYKNYKKVKMSSFVSLFVKSSVIRNVGLPIGEYFIWTDDYEFTGRISKKYPCYFIPSSKVTHAIKSNERVNFSNDESVRLDRYKYIYRNDVHCYKQYGIVGWLYIILKDLYTIVDILLHSEVDKKKKIKIVIVGFFDGLKFYPKISFL